MQGRPAVAWCILLAFLPVSGSASPGADAVHASSATLAGGGIATADLVGLVIEGPSCSQAPSLAMAASRGVLEVDNETTPVWVTPAVGTPSDATREAVPLSGALADGFDLREGCRILALPVPGSALRATATLGASQVLAPAGMAVDFEPRASFDRDQMEIPAGVLPVEAQLGNLDLQAPFRLVVWEASFLLHDGNGTRAVHTGAEAQPLASNPVPAQRNVQREAYFLVDEGNLSVSLGPGVRLYAASMQLDVRTGRFQLHDPEGTLPLRHSPIPAGSKLLELEGPTTTLLAPFGARLGADIQDDPHAVYLDGAVVMTEPVPDGRQFLLLGTFGIVTLAGAVLFAARLKARRRMAQLDKLLAAQRYDEALALARKAQTHRPNREDARLTEATCLIQLSRFTEAREALGDRGWSSTSRPLRDYLLANVEAGSGRKALAMRHLTECLLKAPAFAAEALANPLLAPVVRDALAASRPPVPGESYA